MINLTNEQNDIDKIYLYERDLSELNYEKLIKKREDAGIKHLNNSNAFIVQIGWMMILRTFMIIIQAEEEKF